MGQKELILLILVGIALFMFASGIILVINSL